MKTLVQHMLFPVHEFLKGHSTLSCLRDMEKTQWLNRRQLDEMQSRKLRQFVREAYENVPYYRRIFDACGLDGLTIESREDLSSVPLLTKDEIRRNSDDLRSGKAGNLQRFNTGGSTGSPLVFYMGKDRVSADVAAKLRATRWWGVDVGDPEVVIWGSPVELSRQDMVRQARDWMFRTRLLSAFDMSEETMTDYLRFMRKFRPRHIFGYPSSISLLARFAQEKNIRLDDMGVKVVFCTAEKLYDHQESIISRIFDAPVANGYGGRDAGFVAHACPESQGMHITAESIIVEIVDNDGNVLPPGQRGEIVVTHLDTWDFPFIRYRTGDIGILSDESCSCGRGLPLLREVEGRTTDFIIAPDGRIMHGLSLIYVLRDIAEIKEFKIIQESRNHFVLNIVKTPGFTGGDESRIRAGFTERLGEDIRIDFNYLSGIEAEQSGKFRYVVSKAHHTAVDV